MDQTNADALFMDAHIYHTSKIHLDSTHRRKLYFQHVKTALIIPIYSIKTDAVSTDEDPTQVQMDTSELNYKV